MSLLTGKQIDYYYQDGDTRRNILQNLDFEFNEGTFYSILGESGSGKSTFLSLISGLDQPQQGVITYNNSAISSIGLEKYRRNDIGIIFQNYNLIPYMTALENVLLAMSITDNEVPENKSEVAYNLLSYIGIDQIKADRLVTKLSGGEQQRVAIARSLSTNVNIILADEPTGNLNERIAEEIINIFIDLAHNYNKCVVVVTHSTELAKQSDQILTLSDGKLIPYEQ